MERKEAEYRIKEILKRSSDYHNVYTPFELCDEMISKIPELNKDMQMLVMFNLEFIYVIREKIGDINNLWFLTPDELKRKAAIGMGVNENQIVKYEYNNKKIIDEVNMPKFDVICGNPPYKKNLHLKFLDLAVNSLKKDGIIIWLHPARWLQDPLAPMKKNSDFNKYKDLPFAQFDIIPLLKAKKYFNFGATIDLVISQLKKNNKSIINEEKIYQIRNIPYSFNRLLKLNFKSIASVIEYNKRDGVRVKVSAIGSPADRISRKPYMFYFSSDIQKNIIINGLVNGKDWTEVRGKNQFSKIKGSNIPMSIKFNTVEEAQNFIDSTNTEVFQFFNFLTKLDVHVQLKYLPFMDDYTQPWTNERFQKYFDITNEEMIFIRETMKKYM